MYILIFLDKSMQQDTQMTEKYATPQSTFNLLVNANIQKTTSGFNPVNR